MRAILREAAVAEAARSTADTIWSSPRQVTDGVRTRAQAALDALQAGITIEYVLADKSYFPLQAKDEFLRVQDAANKAREMINAAEAEREKKLVGAAGPAWQEIYTKITLLDNAEDGPQREQLMAQIAELLRTRASGVAGGRVKLALRDQARVLDDTLKEVERFNSWLAEYRQRPELTRLRLGQEVLNKLYASQDIVKWVLPAGQKQVGIWLNKDPKEAADAEKARVAATGAGSTGPKK